MDEVALKPGEVLIQRGRSNHSFFVLLDGQVDVRTRNRRTLRLGPGDFFGEISMETQQPATATVVASSPGRALVMSRSQYRAVRGSATVRARLVSAVSARLDADRRQRIAAAPAEVEPMAEAVGSRSLARRLLSGAGRLLDRLQPMTGYDIYRPYCACCYSGGRCAVHSPGVDWRAGL